MKASRFSDAQKAFIIKQGEDGTPVAEICRKAGISQATYFNWKKKYVGMMPSEMRRLRELEDENNRLKKIVADACAYPLFHFFSLLDAVSDPDTDLDDVWLGATIEVKSDEADEPMLHDELYETYEG